MTYPPQGYPQQAPQQAPQGAPQQPVPQQGYPQQSYPQQGYAPPQQGYPQPQQPFAGPAASAPRPNPFAGIPVSDYVRDGVAAVLLLWSLALPWSLGHEYADLTTSAGQIAALLTTIIAVLSLSAMYLHRAGVIPASVRPDQVATARMALIAPYVLTVLVYLGIDVVKSFTTSGGYMGAPGVGVGAAFGLAGALLAAPPRRCESEASPNRAAAAELWRRVALAIAGVGIALGAFALLALVIREADGSYTGMPFAFHLVAFLDILLTAAAVAALGVPALRRSEAGRLAVIAVTGAYFAATVYDLISGWDLGAPLESVSSSAHRTIPLLALGALYLAQPLRDAMVPAAGPYRYLPAASIVLSTGGVILVVNLVLLVIALLGGGSLSGAGVTCMLLIVLAAVAMLVARRSLRSDPVNARTPVLALLGGLVVLGIIYMIVAANSDGDFGVPTVPVMRQDLVYSLGIPIAVAALLLVPTSMRGYFAGPTPSAAPAGYAAPAPQGPQAPQAPPAAQPATAHGSPAQSPVTAPIPTAPVATPPVPNPPLPVADPALVAAVQHPGTDAATLHRIAAEAPQLRAAVALHPQAYPDLLAWLGSLGDPEVDAALARRGA